MALVCVDTVKQVNNNSFASLTFFGTASFFTNVIEQSQDILEPVAILNCLNLQHAGIVLISYITTGKLLFMCAMFTDTRGKPLQPPPTVATSTFKRMVQWHTWHLHKWQRPEIMLTQLSKDVMEGC